MDKVIFVYYENDNLRIAAIEDGKPVEVIVERKNGVSLVGNVYAGTITNVLPTGFMFVDIGLGKNAFIYLDDGKEYAVKSDYRVGDAVIVQVVKDISGEKGMYVTTKISFTGEFLIVSRVAEREHAHIGISRKITDTAERKRLKRIVTGALESMEKGAFYDVIVRTMCETQDEESVCRELTKLCSTCDRVDNEWKFVMPPALVYSEGGQTIKAVKELWRAGCGTGGIVVFDYEQYLLLKQADIFRDKLTYRETGQEEVNALINKSLKQKIWLKSGGYIVVEKTEACYVIDVNTGKFSGKNHEETVMKVNLEAAGEIARVLRLRNLSGIIIVDFIDMKSETNRAALLEYLGGELKKDRLPNYLYGMTELGLVQITRKKTREPVE